jgi:hypothetical protein
VAHQQFARPVALDIVPLVVDDADVDLSLINITEPTRL